MSDSPIPAPDDDPLQAEADAYFERLAAEALPELSRGALTSRDRPLTEGTRLGPYRILGELNRGGMGTVYLGVRDDGEFDRRVAIKVLRRGLDTDDIIERFRRERQILASLAHPGIASLLDGGATDDGRPYLVMELVEGSAIDAHCDEHGRGIEERLALFLRVADAVHYAHRHLIVHRDLKPSNILVTPEGDVRLLDFGIAKLLGADDASAHETRTNVLVLTPAFASPEQLTGESATTASDVYQLGLLLYLLLCGRPPPDREDGVQPGSRPGLESPPAPSQRVGDDETVGHARGLTAESLRRRLRGDLDAIVLKALRPEPDERYGSVQAMADDVRRTLDGLPIAARPPSVPYRFRKFVGRNRWFPPVAALLLLGLTGFGITRYRHERQLERERNEARTQAERAEQMKDFMVGVFGSADPYTPADPERGRAITVVEALAVGADRARTELSDRPLLRADLLSAIASVYASLDQREPALELLDEVLAIRAVHEPTSMAYLDELGRQASFLSITGRPDSADAAFRRRLALEREIHGADHPRVAEALMGYAHHRTNQGDSEGAFALRSDAERILRAHQPEHRDQLAEVLGSIADTYRELQRPTDAARAAHESLEIYRELLGDDHPNTAMARVHVAQVDHAVGDLDSAIRLYREALPIIERTLGPEHRNTIASWNNLGIVLSDAEDYRGAEEVHRRMLDLRLRLSRGEENTDVAASLQNLAAALIRQGRLAEAESLAVRARGMYLRTTPEGHPWRAFPLMTLTEIRLLERDGSGAERVVRPALDLLRAALPAGHYAIAAAECRLGAALALSGRITEAAPIIREALEALTANEQSTERLVEECSAARDALPSDSEG